MYIVFEGPECSGKTTLAKMLNSKLFSLGYQTLITREPGGYDSDVGNAIRNALFTCPESPNLDITTQALLFAASYRHNLQHTVLPALQENEIVVSDRSNVSALAYQRECPIIDRLVLMNNELCRPDIIFMLLPDYDTVQRRLEERGVQNYKDLVTQEEHNAQLEVYKAFAEIHSNVIVLDYGLSLQTLLDECINVVKDYM